MLTLLPMFIMGDSQRNGYWPKDYVKIDTFLCDKQKYIRTYNNMATVAY